MSANASDKDCYFRTNGCTCSVDDTVTIGWSVVFLGTNGSAGTFPSGHVGDSVQWTAPNVSNDTDVIVQATATDSGTHRYNETGVDQVTLTVLGSCQKLQDFDDWGECIDDSNRHLEQNDRDHVIDGCSIPDSVAHIIHAYTRDNPTGCLSPSSSFIGPCSAHDICYQTCNSNKASCDTNFNDTMADICYGDIIVGCDEPGVGVDRLNYYLSCNSYRNEYRIGVEKLGRPAWRSRQVDYCNCCNN